MKLATLRPANKARTRFGELAIVSADHSKAVRVPEIPSLIDALENWSKAEGFLRELSSSLDDGKVRDAFAFRWEDCLAPLPNTFGFFDGSAFLSHVERARKARGDTMPESAKNTPLMYQGVSDHCLPWNEPFDLIDPAYGCDFEGEFAAITTHVPKGVSPRDALKYAPLVCMFNDWTFREIVKVELETKFGFLQSKPNSAYAPLAVTWDTLGDAWDGERLHLDLEAQLNGERFGNPNGREMHFTFGDLIAHAARTRPLYAGTLIGTGTISNRDAGKGFVCLTERRFQEVLETGKPSTPWLKVGDRVHLDCTLNGRTVFGPIDEVVQKGTLCNTSA